MKVLDNFENYDIPVGFQLSAEQEVQLASDLKEIVQALIPIRGSKLKTRQYFNAHLRYSSNVRDSIPGLNPIMLGQPTNSEYTPLPEEYVWDSDLLHHALRDILRPDLWSFGFVINLMNADNAMRHGYRYNKSNAYSDALVKFAIAFDIDEISKKAEAIDNLYERVRYLNEMNTKFKSYEGLSSDEERWVEPKGKALQALLEGAEKELQLSNDYSEPANQPVQKKKRSIASPMPKRIDVRKGVLYDLSYCSDPRYAELRFEVHGDMLSESHANKYAFSCIVSSMFDRCYDVENDFKPVHAAFEVFPHFLMALMDSYSTHLQQEFARRPREGIKKMYEWVRTTAEIFDDCYRHRQALYGRDLVRTEDGMDVPSQSTHEFKYACMFKIYQCFLIMVDEMMPSLSEPVKKVVPFNLWGGDFEALKKKYTGMLGLETPKRAIVIPEDNIEYYAESLSINCKEFCAQVYNADYQEHRKAVVESTSYSVDEHFHADFRDYIDRVGNEVSDGAEYDDALLTWILTLEQAVVDSYAVRLEKIRERCQPFILSEGYIERFYFDICEKVVFNLAHEYFLDSARTPLISKKGAQAVEQPAEPQPQENPQPPEGVPTKQKHHCKSIDYDGLFDQWNGKAFTGLSLEEFKDAIDYADFSNMLERARTAGQRSGYIGSVKYIIMRLSKYLGGSWYDIACGSIDETPDSMSKLHTTTSQIKKIMVSNLASFIK